jgi:hypothetical protein
MFGGQRGRLTFYPPPNSRPFSAHYLRARASTPWPFLFFLPLFNQPRRRRGLGSSSASVVFIEHHKNLEGLMAEAVAENHKKDLEVQGKHGAKALKYWFNEEKGEVYCLFEAPNAEAAEAVHREAHGNVADEIIEVKEGS